MGGSFASLDNHASNFPTKCGTRILTIGPIFFMLNKCS